MGLPQVRWWSRAGPGYVIFGGLRNGLGAAWRGSGSSPLWLSSRREVQVSGIFNFVPFLLGGALVTVVVILVALPTGLVMGLGLALARIYARPAVSRLVGVYGALMRGVPPVTLLFLIFFVVAGSINISPFLAGTLGLAIISSSYQMEVFRGAIQSVGPGQEIAARAVGMSRSQAIRNIVLPQALRLAIPAWTSVVAQLIKDSALVYALGVTELLRRAQMVSARTYRPLLAFSVAAVLYFLLTFATSRALAVLERKTRIPALAER
jgi:polar amino acid transport system permease protein